MGIFLTNVGTFDRNNFIFNYLSDDNIINNLDIRRKTERRRNNLINKSETIDYEIYPKYFYTITKNFRMNDETNIFFDKVCKLGVMKRFDYINTFQTLSVLV